MYSAGIDIGYSAVKVILINDDNDIKYNKYLLHKGRVRETLKSALEDLLGHFNSWDIKHAAVTGSGSRYLMQNAKISAVNEVAAVIEGGTTVQDNIGSIIDIGGESAKYITGLKGSALEISLNSNCSAGTGAFLEEQMSRLNLRLEDYSAYANRAASIPRIAGRCSVFAKTDIIHHQQEGVPIEDILLGLAYAMVRNYKAAVMKKLPVNKPVLFAGGVAYNQGIIRALHEVLKLDAGELIVTPSASNMGALGAAIISKKENMQTDLLEFLKCIKYLPECYSLDEDNVELPGLAAFGEHDSTGKHIRIFRDKKEDYLACYLGVDVGSTSTNLVLMNENDEIISYRYLKTLGNPLEAVRKGLKELQWEMGDGIDVIGVGVTGSGRYMIGEYIGADIVKDEITAQARAAVAVHSGVDTIFEIGGQDSKFISLEGGMVTDFQMNKICAAGTGSFIEEQAHKFNIPISNFGDIALTSKHPVNLGERCTVFIETSIAAHLSRGARIEDIASGVCYSIAKNYLGRVVGQKKIGKKIFFQGGVAYNQGVVNALRALTGKEIIVPPFFSITGAYGAALLTKEEIGDRKSGFRGFEIEAGEQFNARRKKKQLKTDRKTVFDRRINELIFAGYDGIVKHDRKTVGIPRALFTFGMFSMFYAFFKELDFNVLLSDPTCERSIALGQLYALDETCFPVKLITGHVAQLVEQKVDYIFFPDLYTVDHPGSVSRQNYGCAYMQLAFKVMNQAMELEQKGIELLAPTIAFNLGREFMMDSFASLGEQLGKTRQQTEKALQKAMEAFQSFEARIAENGAKTIKELKADEKAIVIISKIYGVADPVLNMGVPAKLIDMGYKVLPFYDLPEGDVSLDHPNMFWPFGQHILEPAQLVRQHPNLYAILLTHHGCGPDSILSHYFKEIMGSKPYLHIEVDEHSSGVGVITRVEAFINSLKKAEAQEADDMETVVNRIVHKEVNMKKSLNELADKTELYLPYMYPYSQIFKEIMIRKGKKARILPATVRASIDIGRSFALTEEYFSLTALLGDVFTNLYRSQQVGKKDIAFFIPQNEGTETDGQYSRLVRTKLDEAGFDRIDVLSPYIEDVLYAGEEEVESICLGLLAGDLVRVAPRQYRKKHLSRIRQLVESNGCLSLNNIINISEEIYLQVKNTKKVKKILAIGEMMILYNDFLNNFTFHNVEEKGYRVVYAPLSETMWMIWKDFADQNQDKITPLFRQRLESFKNTLRTIAEFLAEESPFEKDLDNLVRRADKTVGYYAGGNGRYRAAKLLGDLPGIDGIITAASMYENTGIVLGILHRGFAKGNGRPLLNLTFDGNMNNNDATKIESFLYYL